MHQSTVLLTNSRGDVYRQTPNGLERIPQPFHYRVFSWLLDIAAKVS